MRGHAGGRAAKERCSQCSARNNRVREYRYKTPEGRPLGTHTLCQECDKIMRKILSESQTKAA